MNRFLILVCIIASLLYGTPLLEKISLQPQWAEQFQFAGYYVAKEKGFYRDAGLDVEIRPFDPKRTAVEEVLSGRSDYGIGRSSLIADRMEGKPVVALAALFQSSPFVLLSLKSAHIETPKDLIGKRVMMTRDFQDAISVRAMLNSQGIRSEELRFIEHSHDPMDLVAGKTDVMACYTSNEPFVLQEKGIAINEMNPEQYGFDFYSDILFTSESELRLHPKRVRAFVDATLKGWEYAFAHIPETAQLIRKRYNSQHKSLKSLVFEGMVLKELAYHGNMPLGAMNADKCRRIADIYRVLGVRGDAERLKGFIYDDMQDRLVSLSLDERSFVHATTVRYMSTFAWPPFNYESDNSPHELKGIAQDMWQLIVQRTGLKTAFIEASRWDEVLDAIRNKRADVTLGTSVSEDKKPFALFSKPYATFPNVIVTDKTIDFLPDLASLKGKRVAVGKGYSIVDYLRKDYPRIKLVEVKNTREGLKMLSAKEVDAVVDILPVVAYLMNADHYVDLKIAGTTEYTFDIRLMIRNDYPQLKSVIDKAIDSISSYERKKIFDRYVAITYTEQMDYTWVYRTIAIALVIIALFVYRQFELGKYNQKLLEMATTDPLTKLANRLRLDEKLTECYHVYLRMGHPFSLIMIDLDFFKQVNDRYGHLVGDHTLKSLAQILRANVRDVDLAGRWGGEEFMVICPETGIEGAQHVADKLQAIIEAYSFETIGNLTCSFGISQCSEGDRIEDVVRRADEALYRAKEEGRNRICVQ